MINEVTTNASIRQAVVPVTNTPVNQVVPVKGAMDAQNLDSHRQEQAAAGKEIPQPIPEFKSISRQNMLEAVSQIQAHVQNIERDLEFRVDEESGRTIVTVINPETKEVVRQIPSEEILRIIHHLNSDGSGLLMEAEA